MDKRFKKIDEVCFDIRTIEIQGATNIARRGIGVLYDVIKISKFSDKNDLINFYKRSSLKLQDARPTEHLLFNGLRYCFYNLNKNIDKTLTILKKEILKSLDFYLDLIEETNIKVIKNGVKIVKNGDHVMTHCHSSSAVKTLILAKKNKIKFSVINTETRPLFQGRLTAMDLHENNIDFTMIVDSEASYFMSPTSGEEYRVDKILMGCDAIGMSGSVINKTGSFGIALSANVFKKPLYISGTLLKCDVNDTIPVESRNLKEVWEKAPKDIKMLNFAFDLIPTKYITGVITEFGIVDPKDIKRVVKEKYPWMFIDIKK